MKIRPASLAGRWYSADPNALRASIEEYLAQAAKQPITGIRAIVAPHAGHVWSGPTAAVAYRALDPEKIRRIFIFCPNHRVPVKGAVSVSVDGFETPLGVVPVDRTAVDAWLESNLIQIDDGAHKLEHAIEIQLPFIQVLFGERIPTIVPIIAGQLTVSEVKAIANRLKNDMRPEDLVLISSDFLHYGEDYGFVPFGAPVQPQIRRYDEQTLRAIKELNGESFNAFAYHNPHAACGIQSLRILAWIFERMNLEAYELAYDTSGRRSGDDDMSVSYFAIAIADPHQGDKLMVKSKYPVSDTAKIAAHALVKRAIQEAVNAQDETPVPKDLDLGQDSSVFSESYGVFVTLKEANGQLRGCIGNILPVANLSTSLWERAQDAAIHDPRFEPVSPDEFNSLDIEISVLTKPEPISVPSEIEIGKHGVILKKHGRTAVFLPQVAPEQGWNVEQMLTALSQKAGLPPQSWREGASFQVFEAQVF